MDTPLRFKQSFLSMVRFLSYGWTSLALLGAVWGGWGCTAVETVPDAPEQGRRAHLVFDVDPPSTELYIDGAYRGTVARWVEGTVPVEPGRYRVELRAVGYITRRFDVDIEAGERRRLRLQMERTLWTPDLEEQEDRTFDPSPRFR